MDWRDTKPETQKALIELKARAEHPESPSALLKAFKEAVKLLEEGLPKTVYAFNREEKPPRIMTAAFSYFCRGAAHFSREEIKTILLPLCNEKFEEMHRKLEEAASKVSSCKEKVDIIDGRNNFEAATISMIKCLSDDPESLLHGFG